MDYVINFLVTFAVFMTIDLLYLGVIAKKFVEKQLKGFMGEIVWPAAVLFYILFVVGLLYFAIDPALENGELSDAARDGALYGFFTYMTYELTNLAVVNKWPRGFVVPDIIWGTVLAASVASISFSILS